MPMTGKEYADLIASYILFNFGERGIQCFREVSVGKSIIGKNRRIDLLVLCESTNDAFAIECKYQGSQGTVEEKLPYSLADTKSMPMAGAVVYAGDGFSEGVLHMLRASEIAAYCLPNPQNLKSTPDTRELDHQLAMQFRWWGVLIGDKEPFVFESE